MKKLIISLIAITVVAGIYAISSDSEAQFPDQTQNVYEYVNGTYTALDHSVALSNYAAKQRGTETESTAPITSTMVNNFQYMGNVLRLEVDDTYLEWWYRGIPKKIVADDIGFKVWSPGTTCLYFTGCADLLNQGAGGIKPRGTWVMPAYYDLVEAARYNGYYGTETPLFNWPMPPKPPFEAGTPAKEGWLKADNFNGSGGGAENSPGYTIFYALWAGVDITMAHEKDHPENVLPVADIYVDDFYVTLGYTMP